ncbi:MAG: phage major capsid protein [Vicinamibacteria bacterium]
MDTDIKTAIEELRELWLSEFERLDGDMDRKVAKKIAEAEAKATKRMDALDVALQSGSTTMLDDGSVEQVGPFLPLERKLAGHFGLERPTSYAADEVRPGALIAAAIGGETLTQYLNDSERKAVLESSGPAGGYLLPEFTASMFLDAVRPKTRVLQAGAQTLAMRGPVVRIPGWDDAPSASWRGEGGAFADAGGTFRRIELSARMIATERSVSIEELEDAGEDTLAAVASRIESEIGRAIAEGIDKAALLGSGADNEPLGLYGTPGVKITSHAAALTDYGFALDDVYDVEARNHEPSAYITSPRVKRDLAKLSDTTGQPLRAPEDVRALKRFVTAQVPEDLGAGANETLVFTGDFSQLLIGLRPSVGVRFQRDPYSQGNTGMVVIRAYSRADVAVLDTGAFSLRDQVL